MRSGAHLLPLIANPGDDRPPFFGSPPEVEVSVSIWASVLSGSFGVIKVEDEYTCNSTKELPGFRRSDIRSFILHRPLN